MLNVYKEKPTRLQAPEPACCGTDPAAGRARAFAGEQFSFIEPSDVDLPGLQPGRRGMPIGTAGEVAGSVVLGRPTNQKRSTRQGPKP